MKIDDPVVQDILRRAMVARIATLSRSGKPSVTSLYFTVVNGLLWLGTADWTLAAREVKADPRVNVLFQVERDRRDARIVRVTGKAQVRTEEDIQQVYVRRVALKYSLSPGGLLNNLINFRLLWPMHLYHQQSASKGLACVIEVTPEQVELISDPLRR